MGISIDLHVHTRRHSGCSQIDPEQLIEQAVTAGLDGLVITEHHYQWPQEELDDLLDRANAPGFILLAGFEYGSACGDLLFYGLEPNDTEAFEPGLEPDEAMRIAKELGAACIAAHPTRSGMGFDERIARLGVDAMEVRSSNLQNHEQRLAERLAESISVRPIAASDAHLLRNVGLYMTEFVDPLRTMDELREALIRGRFQLMETRNLSPAATRNPDRE